MRCSKYDVRKEPSNAFQKYMSKLVDKLKQIWLNITQSFITFYREKTIIKYIA